MMAVRASSQVQSFGVGNRVKLPGESADSPNAYGKPNCLARTVGQHRYSYFLRDDCLTLPLSVSQP